MNRKLTLRQKTGLLAAAALLFLVCYLSLCFNNNIWTDEAFTIELLHADFAGIIHGTASDVHPPLYYLIAKCFVLVFGSSLLSLKIVSIIPMLLCMTWGAAIVWKRFGFHTALAFDFLLGVIPCTMEYAVQVRMYSWAIFFITFMGLWAYEAYLERKWRYFAGVVLTSAAAAYTHYFAFVSAILIYGFLFLALALAPAAADGSGSAAASGEWAVPGERCGKRIPGARAKGLRQWLLSVCASLLLFAPWIPYMRLQVKGVSKNYWITEITGETVKEFFPFLFDMDIPGTTVIWLALVAAGIAAAVLMIVRRECREGMFALLCLLTPVLTAVTGVVASNLLRPVFIVRYLLPCMGLLAVFLAVTLCRYVPRPVYIALLVFLFCAGLVDYKQSVYREYQWTHTAETEAFLESHVGERDIIAYNYESYKFVYDYYWSDEEKMLWQGTDLDNCPYETIWLLDTIYWPTPTDAYLAEHGWQRQFMGNYGIEHNDFKIYAVTRLPETPAAD